MDSQRPESNEQPALFNIGAVARMTGVPVATIRVWERRYGFPVAERTAGGHRIYTEREVERLSWVKARIDAGLKASQAVRALEHRATAAPDRLAPVGNAVESKPLRPGSAGAPGSDAPALDSLQQRFVEALLDHDLERADRVLGDTLAVFPLDRIILEVIRPSMAQIGQGWVEGEVTVATEHLASHFVRQRLLSWMSNASTAAGGRTTVLASAPEDWHELGLLMMGALLVRRGWPVSYLGAAVPLPDLAEFVRETRPAAVVLVAMTPETADGLKDWPTHLPQAAASGSPPVCYAGRAFSLEPSLREQVPGEFLGDTIESGLERLEAILRDAAR